MSWSEGREKDINATPKKNIKNLKAINDVLKKLSEDSDLKEDLGRSDVKEALLHWTNVKRLSPEESQKFEDNYRISAVLQKLQTFQHVCNLCGITVPFDHFLESKSELSNELVQKHFGHDMVIQTKESNASDSNNLLECEKSPLKDGKTAEDAEDKSDSSQLNAFEKIIRWGNENPNSPEFSWMRFIIRCFIDAVLLVLCFMSIKSFIRNYNAGMYSLPNITGSDQTGTSLTGTGSKKEL